MFRWHYVKDNDWPKCYSDCFCQLDSDNLEFKLLEFEEREFLDDQYIPRKVYRWCYVDDIARALNDITRAFMQSEAVRKETDDERD